MKIAILTICTGKYNMFFEDLYNSFEEFFLKDLEKEYYVFTDGEIQEAPNVTPVYQQKLGWPHDTMMRFHMFNRIESEISKNDFVFFVNANMKAIKEIGKEIIPSQENDFLMGAHHPGFIFKDLKKYPYDRNPSSTCYIPFSEGKIYYQGCFNGGRVTEFMKMSKTLAKNIDIDLENDIVPLWHDESQLNWYYKNLNPLALPCSYVYPESWNIPTDKIMIQRDKNKHGGHAHLRGSN